MVPVERENRRKYISLSSGTDKICTAKGCRNIGVVNIVERNSNKIPCARTITSTKEYMGTDKYQERQHIYGHRLKKPKSEVNSQ